MTLHIWGVEPEPRRVRRLEISAELFLDWLQGADGSTALICETVIPTDARVVGLTVDSRWNTVTLYVESETFDVVVHEGVAPPLDVRLRTWTLSPEERLRQQEYDDRYRGRLLRPTELETPKTAPIDRG